MKKSVVTRLRAKAESHPDVYAAAALFVDHVEEYELAVEMTDGRKFYFGEESDGYPNFDKMLKFALES